MYNSYNTPVIIGVDTGNKLTKTVNTRFVSGIDITSDNLKIPTSDPMCNIRFNGQNYGTSLERTKWERDKTQNNVYLILTMMAIARELQIRRLPTSQEVILSVGLPPGHLQNNTSVNRLKQYYMSNGGEYHFQCGGNTYFIKIRDVIVCPQGYSALLTLDNKTVLKPNLFLIDIGGGTSDTVHLENGKGDNKVITLDMGVIPMSLLPMWTQRVRRWRCPYPKKRVWICRIWPSLWA